ncbi:MAG TPA: cytochrome c oxidase subunit II [Gemmatimonadota bacterium]|nr:cytochrome c oxidase subunit II [Gemmatimonadota bacterium]
MRTRKPAVFAAVFAALAFVGVPAALAQPGGLGPPEPATPSGDAINQLYWFVFAICAAVFVLVETVLILFIVRFRRRKATAEDVEGPQIHGNTRLEIIWTLIPALILVGIAVVVFLRVPAVQATGGDRSNELVVRVEAHQFYWQYVYPDGTVSLDTLVLPVDRPVTLRLRSFDVNHSWWVPELTGKRDALAGKITELSFRPEREGTYEGQCAEFCGLLHAVMPTTVRVVPDAEYEDWLALQGAQDETVAGRLALGRDTWDQVCAKCHGLAGEGDSGPPIAGSGTLVNEQALRQILLEGQNRPNFTGYMPPVGRGWPDYQVEALIEYIRSNERIAPPSQGQDQAQGGDG